MTEERVALVTGAARGIGAATVRELRSRGLRVVAVDSCLGDDREQTHVGYPLGTHADLEAVAAGDDGVRPVVCDVRDQAGLMTAAESFERLDVVVAAAAVIAGGKPLWRRRARTWSRCGRWTRWGCGGPRPSPCR